MPHLVITRLAALIALVLSANLPGAEGVWVPIAGSSAGFSGHVWNLTPWRGGLIAGGHFLAVGDVPASNLAKWDGATWSAIPGQTGVDQIEAAAVLDDDLVVARRVFPGVSERIWRFDGTAWTPIAGCPLEG